MITCAQCIEHSNSNTKNILSASVPYIASVTHFLDSPNYSNYIFFTFFLLNRSVAALLFSLMYCSSCLSLSAQQAAPVEVINAEASQPVLPFAHQPVLPFEVICKPGFPPVPVILNTKGNSKGGVIRVVSPGLGQGTSGSAPVIEADRKSVV